MAANADWWVLRIRSTIASSKEEKEPLGSAARIPGDGIFPASIHFPAALSALFVGEVLGLRRGLDAVHASIHSRFQRSELSPHTAGAGKS